MCSSGVRAPSIVIYSLNVRLNWNGMEWRGKKRKGNRPHVLLKALIVYLGPSQQLGLPSQRRR